MASRKRISSHAQRCHYCGCRVFLGNSIEGRSNPKCIATRDHVLPQMFGNPEDVVAIHSSANVVTACQHCNGVKGSDPVELFEFFLAAYLGTPRFTRQEFIKFVYGCALAGFKTAHAEASQAMREKAAPVPHLPLGRHTLRDLRRPTPSSSVAAE